MWTSSVSFPLLSTKVSTDMTGTVLRGRSLKMVKPALLRSSSQAEQTWLRVSFPSSSSSFPSCLLFLFPSILRSFFLSSSPLDNLLSQHIGSGSLIINSLIVVFFSVTDSPSKVCRWPTNREQTSVVRICHHAAHVSYISCCWPQMLIAGTT